MIKIRRLGHATLSTPHIDRQIDHFSRILGLTVIERTADRAFLCSRQGLEAVELVRGDAAALKRLSLQVAPTTDLREVAETLSAAGIACERRTGISPGIEEAITFEDPNGTAIDIFAGYSFPKVPRVAGSFNLLKLGHVASCVKDVQKTSQFYSELFGFRASDWRGDFFVFLRCGTDHHTLNFVRDENPRLHHIAFEVLDWSEVRKTVDSLAENNVHLAWGPGRHVIGHNVATYHNSPDQVRIEIFTEMDQMKDEELGYFDPRPWHQEFPLFPKVHGPETLRNYWGFASERSTGGRQNSKIPGGGSHAAIQPA